MWSSTVGLVNGKHRYLTAETFGFKINANGQTLKKKQQWTLEPFFTQDNESQTSAAYLTNNNNSNQQQQEAAIGDAQLSNCPTIGTHLMMSITRINSNDSSTGSQPSLSSQLSDPEAQDEHENVAIKSHLNKYLAVDAFGNVTCDSDEKTENARFTITICSMSQSSSDAKQQQQQQQQTESSEQIFWAFKNIRRGYYLGTTEDGMICCNAKIPKSRAELWLLHLTPARGSSFFALRSVGRKRYAHVVSTGDNYNQKQQQQQQQVQLDATLCWDPETLFQFQYVNGGRYALMTSDYRYITNAGQCINACLTDGSKTGATQAEPPVECLFTLEYHSGFVAFRDHSGHYLAATGRSSVLKTRSIGVSRDELFTFEPAPTQVSMRATFNRKWVSIRQGVDLSANQSDASSTHETFQMNSDDNGQTFTIMTQDCSYWAVSGASALHVAKPPIVGPNGTASTSAAQRFRLVWNESDSTFSLQVPSVDHRWVCARKSGQLYLGPPASTERAYFTMRFQNRRSLNLRPVTGSGFVGARANDAQGKLEANKTTPDSLLIEYVDEIEIEDYDETSAIALTAKALAKQIELESDANNNNNNDNNINHNNNEIITQQPDGDLIKSEPQEPEEQTTPSVAAIISSLSNAKLTSGQPKRSSAPIRVNSTIQMQARRDCFENNTSTNNRMMDTKTSSITTKSNGSSNASEFCYLKLIGRDKYLSLADNAESVCCEASDRCEALRWIIELRSHDSVALREAHSNSYMQLGSNGTITLIKCSPDEASLWASL